MILRDRLAHAVEGEKGHRQEFERFSEEVGRPNVELWTAQVVTWEKDPDKPDPYYIAPSGEHTKA